MGTQLQAVGGLTNADHAILHTDARGAADSAPFSLVSFIEENFIPNHVSLKSTAGRMHYQAIMKYIIRPETVEALFAPYPERRRARMKAISDWPYLDSVALHELSATHVQRLIASASAYGYSPQTIKHIKNVIGAIISHAKKEHAYAGDNPVWEVKLPPLVHTRTQDLTIEQAKTVLRLLKYPEREIALVSMTTGLGISEICALRWKHINMTQTPIWVDGEFLPPCGILVRKRWDGAAGADANTEAPRVVVVPASLIGALARVKRITPFSGPDSFVVATPQGEPIDPANARTQRLKPIGRKLQIPWLSWQVLKRAHGALLSELSLQLADDLVVNAR